MGGHGGLNILPQKSWNVYGRENRLKVSRDEAKHAEEQRLKAEKQRLAESEVRRAFLLRQAALKRGEAPEEEQAQLATPPEQPAAQGGLLLQHINFFQEHEAHELNPEVVEEGRKEARRRGDAATQTSDARFDERFQFGHGLTGSSNQPWYAKKGPSLLGQPEEPAQMRIADDGRPLTSAGLGPGSLEGGQAQQLLLTAAAAHRSSSSRKDKKRSREKKAHKKNKAGEKRNKLSSSSSGGKPNIEQLREERRQREQAERERARQAVMGGGGAAKGKSYHAAYGNVAPSKRPVSAV